MATLILLGWGHAEARAERLRHCQENAIIVFDASGSMGATYRVDRKIEVARRAIADVLPDIARWRPTGLVTYSGGPASTCNDVVLRVPPSHNTSGRIIAELAQLLPRGPTALSSSVQLAAQTLERMGTSGDIVLITDGHETCMQSACDLARHLRRRETRVRVHTIGFRLKGPGLQELLCLSHQTGGMHSTAHDLTSLRDSLRRTLSCPRVSTLTTPSRSPPQVDVRSASNE
ncbi:MAG: vWA domain-containing protein [Hyphomicrobiaceae bacterium]